MKEEVRQKVMERFSISEQAMQLLLESAEMMSFVPKDIIVHEGEINTNMYILSRESGGLIHLKMGRKIPFGSPWRARSHSRYGDILPALLLFIP